MNFYPIFKKELRLYFTSLIAYVVLAVFLVIAGYYFYTDLALFVLWGGASVQEGLWQYLFHDIRLILLFTIPLLTMRLFSEEKKLGTIELLFTYPFRDMEILLGKYLACLTVFSIMLGFTVLYPVLLAIVYQVEVGPLLASYLGMFLLGSAFISCGIMVSSLTENQIVAALITSGIILTFWFIDWNEAAVSPSVAVVLHHLSFFEHFYNFVRGVIDTKDIVYFILFTFFFFVSNASVVGIQAMERIALKRFLGVFGLLSVMVIVVSLVIYLVVDSLLTYAVVGLLVGMVCLLIYVALSFEYLSAYFTRQSTKYGLNMLVTVTVLLVIIGLIEVISSRNNKRFDLTEEGMLTLSPLTKKVLHELDQDVSIIVFYNRDQIFEFRDLLKQYTDETDKISYQFFNLDQNPGRAKEYRVSTYGAVVIESQGRRKTYNYCTEDNITNGIIRVTRKTEEVIYFLKGHGESDCSHTDEKVGYSRACSALETEGYTVKSLLLLRQDDVPEDASLLIIAGPEQNFLPTELQAISDYVAGGGKVLFMLDPYTVPNVVDYLKRYNIRVGANMVVDKESKLFAGDIFSPVVPYYRDHPITQGFDTATVFPLVCSVEPIDPPQSDDADAVYLARSTPESWAETDIESIKQGDVYFQEWEDTKGPISVVAIAEVYGKAKGTDQERETGNEEQNKKEADDVPKGRIIVCGDSDFARNIYITILGNKDFFLNMVNWLAGSEERISVRHKKEQAYPFSPLFLTENQKSLVFWFSVVIPPLLILSIGIFIYARRKMRG